MSETTAATGAADCKPQSKIISDLWTKWAEESTTLLGGKAAAITAMATSTFNQLVDKMNAFASNGWATVGPRMIEFGRTQAGTLVIPGDRTFLSSHPLENDRATISITKKDGKGGAVVTICKVDDKGRYTKLTQVDLATGKAGLPKTETVTVEGLANHVLQVLLDGQGGGPASKLAYDLKVTKQ